MTTPRNHEEGALRARAACLRGQCQRNLPTARLTHGKT
jgi:hypothetical protein